MAYIFCVIVIVIYFAFHIYLCRYGISQSIIVSISIVSVTIYGIYSTWYWQESEPNQATWYNSSMLYNVRSLRKSLSADLKHLKSSEIPLIWGSSLLYNLLPEYRTAFWKNCLVCVWLVKVSVVTCINSVDFWIKKEQVFILNNEYE